MLKSSNTTIMSFLDTLIPIFVHYKYAIILPIAVVEGPIITIVSGFLVSLKYLDFYIVFFIVVLGDIIGDTGYYMLGRYGRSSFIWNYGHYIGLTQGRIEKIDRHFAKHSSKTLLFGKFAHGLGSIIWVAAGMSRVNYWKFFWINLFTTAVKSYILLLIGFYFGKAYVSINTYLGYVSTVGVIVFIVIYTLAIKTNLVSKFIGLDDFEDINKEIK